MGGERLVAVEIEHDVNRARQLASTAEFSIGWLPAGAGRAQTGRPK